MAITVNRADLSQYETFRITAPHGNHVTIAVRGQSHYPLDGGQGRYSIHLMIWGDFGPWEHYWSHAGGPHETWWNWLHDTNMDYWLGKMVADESEFDVRKSVAYAHRYLDEIWKEVRHEPGVKRSDFHAAHLALRDIEDRDQFFRVVSELTYDKAIWIKGLVGLVSRSFPIFEDYYSMGHHRIKPRLVWFWDNIWRPFIEQARHTKGFNQQDCEGSLK